MCKEPNTTFSSADPHPCRRLTTLLLCGLLAFTQCIHSVSYAQTAGQEQQTGTTDIDTEPPIIELEEIPEGVAGQNQVFTALVADNQQLKDVRLYYRFAGTQSFSRVEMEVLSNTDYYTASIETSEGDDRDIEYYIQARDEAGNRVVKGFAFDPLKRGLIPARAPQTTATNPPVASEPEAGSGGFKVWQIVLGVLAVGALAAAAGSGGGGGGGGSTGNGETVPLTLTIDVPQ